ncbi:DivIVA domain-containing protein [Parafrankia sp. FMc2]|uniref:DivIVA domain-containing protein n=1 Tax=Parafrankia sp. FMc2 TaxID=3233196 RepID=UPI0034D564B6
MVLAVEIVLIATVVFVVAALAVGRFDRLAPAVPDGPHVGLGGQTVVSGDIEAVRFGMAVRGYRMAEVDAVLSRLAYELAWRDEELARRDDELLRLAELARLGGVQNPATDSGDDTPDQLSTDSAPTDSGTSADRGAICRPAGEPGPAGERGPAGEPDPAEPGPAGGRDPVSDPGTSADLGVARGDARHDGPDRDEPCGPRPVQDQPGEPGTASRDKEADG